MRVVAGKTVVAASVSGGDMIHIGATSPPPPIHVTAVIVVVVIIFIITTPVTISLGPTVPVPGANEPQNPLVVSPTDVETLSERNDSISLI